MTIDLLLLAASLPVATATDVLCTHLNGELHGERWGSADAFLVEAASIEERLPVLVALIMMSAGAAAHLPARSGMISRILARPDLEPGARAAVSRMSG